MVHVRARARCERDIIEGLQAGQLEWEDVWHLAQRWRVGRADLQKILRDVHRKAVAGEEEELDDRLETAREFLQKHEQREPYAELPENIGLRLTEIEKSDTPESARQLAQSLTAFYLENKRKLEKQRRLTFWGIFFGAAGILIGVLGIYLALNTARTQKNVQIIELGPVVEAAEITEPVEEISKPESAPEEMQEEANLAEQNEKQP